MDVNAAQRAPDPRLCTRSAPLLLPGLARCAGFAPWSATALKIDPPGPLWSVGTTGPRLAGILRSPRSILGAAALAAAWPECAGFDRLQLAAVALFGVCCWSW